ncbi:MAG: RluA family pseudouridine synthase [Treponema sp.]|uniref:RluA family pseudouridine synthase n=1 Tax=Treponema sp. TaxID=166 RepID=UPI0025ED85FD|nr:RluA family pseudouridine synthase [Treponema sp.]MBQ9282996.1 RluA family pseudouridine synthase [Treponema sp.]
MREIPVLFEDDEIFVINKPAGVAVQGGEGIAHPLDEEFSRQVGFKVHLVHRLDKETCGLMVIAKNSKAASKWIDLIASKQVQKEYTAICFNEPLINGKKVKSGTISGSVVRKNGKNEREQSAVTNFTVEEVFTREVPAFSENPEEIASKLIPLTFSKIHLKLGTGRMHQIRIHLASVASPICGDDKHGNFKLNKIAKKTLKIKNLLLCSSKLTIPTGDGKSQTFQIELPDYFLCK